MMSFFIPFVFDNHDPVYIRRVFHELHIGMVDRVDYISVNYQTNICTAFVHLKYWYHTENADSIFNGIENGNEITIVLNSFENTNRYWVIRKMLCPKISNKAMKKYSQNYPHAYKLHSLTKLHKTIDDLNTEIEEKTETIDTSNKTIAKLERCLTGVLTGKIGVIPPIDNRPLTDLERLLQTDSQINYKNTHRQNSHKRFI